MLLVQALARAFGLGYGQGSGSWGKDGHVWATVDGIGVVDTTAIQQGYGFRSPKVKGYSGGSSRPVSSQSSEKTVNIGDINVHVNGKVEDAKETGRQIADEINDRIFKVLKRSDATGL